MYGLILPTVSRFSQLFVNIADRLSKLFVNINCCAILIYGIKTLTLTPNRTTQAVALVPELGYSGAP